jgi:uncharacterized protein with PIN domain
VGVLLDAQALVALLRDEPAAPDVDNLLRRGLAAMTAPNLAETLDALVRVDRYEPETLRALIDPLGIDVIPMASSHAWRAAELRARHYLRDSAEVSIPDCVLVAAATPGDTVATADGPVLDMAKAEGIATFVLPDSRGQRAR